MQVAFALVIIRTSGREGAEHDNGEYVPFPVEHYLFAAIRVEMGRVKHSRNKEDDEDAEIIFDMRVWGSEGYMRVSGIAS